MLVTLLGGIYEMRRLNGLRLSLYAYQVRFRNLSNIAIITAKI
jgi:hypothetical protein